MLLSTILGPIVEHLPERLLLLGGRLHELRDSALALPSEEAAAWSDLPAQLWALHSCLCRLVATLSSPATPLKLPTGQLAAHGWRNLQFSLSASLRLMLEAHQLRLQSDARNTLQLVAEAPRQGRGEGIEQLELDVPDSLPRSAGKFAALGSDACPSKPGTVRVAACREVLIQLQAACAGHVPAMQAAAAAAAAGKEALESVVPRPALTSALAALVVAAALPDAADTSLLAPLEALFRHPRSVRGQAEKALQLSDRCRHCIQRAQGASWALGRVDRTLGCDSPF